MDGTKREAIIAKVRALLAKTIENGATEAEALFAAAKAAELMAKYDLEMDEVEAREAGVKRSDRDMDPVFAKHLSRVCGAIAELCGVKTWGDGSGALLSRQTFYGLPHDVEVAGYLLEICERAMKNDLARVSALEGWALRPRRRGMLSDSFLEGMSRRLAERISELAWARHRATGSALVPVKDALIEQAMADEGIELENSRLGRRDLDPATFLLGRAAGEKVGLNAAVGGAGQANGHLPEAGEDELVHLHVEKFDGWLHAACGAVDRKPPHRLIKSDDEFRNLPLKERCPKCSGIAFPHGGSDR